MTKERIPIFLAADDNYAAYLPALMISITDNTESMIDFYVVDGGISAYKKKAIAKLRDQWHFGLEYIRPEPYRARLKMPTAPSGHITRASYDRFLIPYMKPELDKAIILDVDMIALGDIKKLWDVNLGGGKVLAAAPALVPLNKEEYTAWADTLGLDPAHVYFNMGAMLIDFRKWRTDDLTSAWAATKIRFDTNQYYYWDEILLNLVLQTNNYTRLGPEFNMLPELRFFCQFDKPKEYRWMAEERMGLPADYKVDEIILAHFLGKPWQRRTSYYPPVKAFVDIPNFKDFWHYMKLSPFYEEEMLTLQQKLADNRFDLYYKTYCKRKYKCYRLLSVSTLGLVPRFRQQAEEYKRRYKTKWQTYPL